MMKKVISVIVCFAVAILMAVAAWPGRSGRRWRGRLRRAGRLICKAVFGHRRRGVRRLILTETGRRMFRSFGRLWESGGI